MTILSDTGLLMVRHMPNHSQKYVVPVFMNLLCNGTNG